MQKYIFIICISTISFLGCRSTHKPVQVEKEPEKRVEIPKVDDSKKGAQKNQETEQQVKIEEVAVTARERKVKNMPLDRLQILSKSNTAIGAFTSVTSDILPQVLHNTEE